MIFLYSECYMFIRILRCCLFLHIFMHWRGARLKSKPGSGRGFSGQAVVEGISCARTASHFLQPLTYALCVKILFLDLACMDYLGHKPNACLFAVFSRVATPTTRPCFLSDDQFCNENGLASSNDGPIKLHVYADYLPRESFVTAPEPQWKSLGLLRRRNLASQ